jgi:hypothetical protein
MRNMKNIKLYFIFHAVLYLLLTAALYGWYSFFSPVEIREENGIRISDYVYYLLFVRAFWFEGISSIYNYDSFLIVLSQFLGGGMKPLPMPLGVTPVVLIFWFPFSCLSFISFDLAQAAWVSFSLQLFLTELFLLSIVMINREYEERIGYYLLLAVSIGSFDLAQSVALGQTSIFASGALLSLGRKYFSDNIAEKPGIDLFSVFLLFGLSIKPHYLSFALGLLMLRGQFRTACTGVGISLFVTLLLTLRLDPAWVSDYLSNLKIFASADIPEVYAHAFFPQSMNLFSSAFSFLLGRKLSILISNAVLIIIFGSVFFFSLIHPRFLEKFSRLAYKSFRDSGVYLLLAAYLLFSPYAGFYEDLLLIAAVFMFLIWRGPEKFILGMSLFFSLLLVVLLNHNMFPEKYPMLAFWLIKAMFFCYLLRAVLLCNKKKKDIACSK